MFLKLFSYDNRVEIKRSFRMVFKNSIFIWFSFVNLFIPFFATMMAALTGSNSAINVIGIGLSTSFITIFNQFLFLIAMITFYILNQHQDFKIKSNSDFYAVWLILLIFSLVICVLFVGFSFLYISFSSIYQNIFSSVTAGYKYIAIVMPSLILNTYIYMHVMRKRQIHKIYGYLLLFALFSLNLIFIPVIGVIPNWSMELSTFGIGLGINVSSFILFIIIVAVNWTKNFRDIYFDKSRFLYILFKTKNFCINFILSTILKSILVMILAISLNLGAKDTPPALMIAKIIWYNSLFFCGFFGDGLFYTIHYTRLINNKYQEKSNYEVWICFALLSFFITFIICVIFNFISMELAKLYVSHQTLPINNPLPNWPYGNHQISYQEVQDYLWSASTGVYNFNLLTIGPNHQISYGISYSYALLYVTLYHVIINTTKILGIEEIKFNQKFSWKKMISNFVLISIVMIFVVGFSVGGADNKTIYTTFPGIDAFSFSLLLIIVFLFLLTLIGFIKNWIKSKQYIYAEKFNY